MRRKAQLASSILSSIILFCIACNLEAAPVLIDLNTPFVLEGADPGQNAINQQINIHFDPIPGNPISDWVKEHEIYKGTPGNADEGLLSGSYNTTFFDNREWGEITYAGSGPIIAPIAYLLVKDGNNDPSWRFYDLTALGWTGTELITLDRLWPNQGSYSHIAMYGVPGEGGEVPVPEPQTLMLLGGGLAALALIRRFRS